MNKDVKILPESIKEQIYQIIDKRATKVAYRYKRKWNKMENKKVGRKAGYKMSEEQKKAIGKANTLRYIKQGL